MTPGVRTEAEYRVRTILGPDGRSWIIRDEYDEHGEVIGSQQLGSDGRWSEIQLPGTELWDGHVGMPTTEGTHTPVGKSFLAEHQREMERQFIYGNLTATTALVNGTTTATYPSMMTVNGSTITATGSTTPFLDALSKNVA